MTSEPDVTVLRRSIDQPDWFAVLFDRHFAQVHRYLRHIIVRSRRRVRLANTASQCRALNCLQGVAGSLVVALSRRETRFPRGP